MHVFDAVFFRYKIIMLSSTIKLICIGGLKVIYMGGNEMLHGLRSLKIRTRLFLLTGFFILVFVLFAIYYFFTMNMVKVNGPFYKQIVQGKDLIADILPPPDYIIESYLMVKEMVDETDKTKIDEQVARYNKLKGEYFQRHDFWEKNLPNGKMKDTMIVDTYKPAVEFYKIMDTKFIPAIQIGDKLKAKTLALGTLKQNYEQHREKVDEVVTMAAERNKQDEKEVEELIQSRTNIFILISLIAMPIMLFLSIILSVSIIKPIKRLATAADMIALGDVSVDVQSDAKDEVGNLMSSFGKMIESIREQALAADKIAAGDLNVEVNVLSEKDILAKSMNSFVQTLRNLIWEMDNMSKQHDAGDIDVVVPEEKFQGAYRTMVKGVNGMVNDHISLNKKAMACIEEFARGNFDAPLEKFPGKKAFINENIERLRSNIKDFIADMNNMSQQHDAGDIDVVVPEEKFQGAYRVMAKGVNDMVNGHISVKKKAMACVAEFAKGNFDAPLEKFPGKKVFINENIEGLRKNLKDVSSEINQLIVAAMDGRLETRANYLAYNGNWADIMSDLNKLLEAVVEPIKEAASVLDEMSKGNLQSSVNGEYKGDHGRIKNAMNDTIDTINEILSNINSASEQVAAGSKQVSYTSQILSQGSTEQTCSIEEITASITQVAAQTKQNSMNANQANKLVISAKDNAIRGNEHMQEMLKSMSQINDASSNISKIIKVIDGIAFQTNILALNASVEAARAGQHGKGFRVVAEEVRNLAARSANAAKETTAMIEGSIKKVGVGTKIANETAEALKKIVDGVAEAATIVAHIAEASNEQAAGIEQINTAIEQTAQVVQTNSATAEESASASEQLSAQAEILKESVKKFKLKKSKGISSSNIDTLSPEVIHMIESMIDKKKQSVERVSTPTLQAIAVTSKSKIALDGKEFGKY